MSYTPNRKYNELLNQILDPVDLMYRLRKLQNKYNHLRGRIVISDNDVVILSQQLPCEIVNNSHVFHPYTEKIITDGHSGKQRVLHIPHMLDRIYESVIMMVVEPAYAKKWTSIPYAAITGRGLTKAVERVKRSISYNHQDWSRYALKIDIVKYYENIDHGLLFEVIDRYFRNEPVLSRNLKSIVNSYFPGLPIGTYSSQFLANLFLADLDYACIHASEKNICQVTRYMDDILVVCRDYDKVQAMQQLIVNWCADHKLAVHTPEITDLYEDNHHASVPMIGFNFNHKGTWVKESTLDRVFAKYNEICERIEADEVQPTDLNSVASMNGWLCNGNTRHLREVLNTEQVFSYLKSIQTSQPQQGY